MFTSGPIAHFAKLSHMLPPNTNPAEFLLDIINAEFVDPQEVQKVIDAWAGANILHGEAASGSVLAELSTAPENKGLVGQISKPARELYFVLTRQVCIIFRDPMLYLGRAIMFLLTGVLIAIFYIKDRSLDQSHVIGRFWTAGWFLSVPSLFGVVAVYAFNEEFKSIRTEVKNGMFSARSYLLSTLLMQLPMMPFLGICAVGVSGFGM